VSDKYEHGDDSIRFNCEFNSNEIDESEQQDEKHDDPRISTFRGIEIDRSDEDENIFNSIRFNREFNLNEIDESDLEFEKHDDPRVSTFRGISIDATDDDENADDLIDSIVNVIQMRMDEVVYSYSNSSERIF
jgi:hypothetical protein